jgi:hypothetical protein
VSPSIYVFPVHHPDRWCGGWTISPISRHLDWGSAWCKCKVIESTQGRQGHFVAEPRLQRRHSEGASSSCGTSAVIIQDDEQLSSEKLFHGESWIIPWRVGSFHGELDHPMQQCEATVPLDCTDIPSQPALHVCKRGMMNAAVYH